jgi:hypothetical protein
MALHEMSTIDELRNEISTDPLGRGYSDMQDSEVADSLNEPSRNGMREVPSSDVRMYVLLHGLWPAFQAAATTSPDPTIRATAITILQTIGAGSFDTIRMNRADVYTGVSQMLQTMVSAGVMTEQNRAEMLALGETMVSRAQELGLGQVHHLQVAEARLG